MNKIQPSSQFLPAIILLAIAFSGCAIKPLYDYQKSFEINRRPLSIKLDSLENIYKEAHEIGVKTQYETDSEYFSRLKTSWKHRGIHYFAIDGSDGDLVKRPFGQTISYNPNNKIINILIDPDMVPVNKLFYKAEEWSSGGASYYSRAYSVYESRWTANTRPMQNLYGAKFDTAYTDVTTYMLDLINAQDGIPMRVSATSDTAKDLIESNALTFILGVEFDSIANFYSDDVHLPSTTKITTAYSNSRKIARATLREVILCDTRTAEVLASYKVNGNITIPK